MSKKKTTTHSRNQPEKKIGPFPGGIGIAIWLNALETDDGIRKIRSISISPRRYQDSKTGEWKDGSFRPGDIPALIFALQKAQEYIYSLPLPEDKEPQDDNVPF